MRCYECGVSTDGRVDEIFFEALELIFDLHAGFDFMYSIVVSRLRLKLKNAAEW